MDRRMLAWTLVAVVVAAAAAWLTFWSFRATRAQGRGWVPFVAVIVERQYQSTLRAPVRVQDSVYARRSDGSTVEDVKKQIMPNGGWADLRIVMDYGTATRTSIDPSTESLTSYHYPATAIARLAAPPTVCSSDPTAKHTLILGYDAVAVERALAGPRPDWGKATDWEAPQLNCFPLMETVEFGGGAGTLTREALLVKEGDPPPVLFEIPSGYVERAPSEVMAERARRFPADEAAQAAASQSQALDDAYKRHGRPPAQ
jgi:hypothetical protein